MHRLIRFCLILLQSLAIPLTAGLFLCAVTGDLQQQRLVLEWPYLIDSYHPALDILGLSLPGILLYALLASLLRRRAVQATGLLVLTLLTSYSTMQAFATVFGNTWTPAEVFFELYVAYLHLLALALLPGLLLWWLPTLAPDTKKPR